MKILKLVLCIALSLCEADVIGQSSYPYALEKVNFDAATKRVDKIPFDRPFVVEIENLSAEGIEKIFVYEMTYDNANGRCFKRTLPDITILQKDITVKEKKISFIMPALRPQKHFDIVLIRKEADPYTRTIDLNKSIYYAVNKKESESLFIKLKGFYEVTQFCNLPASSVIPGDIDAYLGIYNAGVNDIMKSIATFEKICTEDNIDETKFAKLTSLSKECCKSIDSAALVTFCEKGTSMDLVFKGFIRLSDISRNKVDTFDLLKRIANLESSIVTLGQIRVQTAVVLSLTQGGDNDILCDIDKLINCLAANKKTILSSYKEATALLDEQFYFNNNLISTTLSKDLQTESNNRFLLDLGFANIVAQDNRDKLTYIPKLAWGMNILMRPIDKNVPINSLPGSIFDKNSSGLLAKKTIWHYLSLYVGLTIGEMSEPEFGDFYNKTSVMIGPSVRLYRALRISFGPAFLRRVSGNPVITHKTIAAGMFATASVDIDLLKSINSITSIITK